MSTGSSKPNKAGPTPPALTKRKVAGDDTDLTVALPDERQRPSLARGGQMGTDPPTTQRGLEDQIGVEPTHVGAPGPADDPYVGRIMSDRYRIIRKIGEGGMGTVYLAEHVVIEKKVALKILSDDLARKGDLVTRFMQEAKAASRIGHENIVDITDFGQTDAGSVFFAMEYLEGADLATVIREQGPMAFPRVRQIVMQICRALGAAHGKGIIHRDMKPENIYLVERDGRSDFVKILDFGIAKMSSMDEAGERLTRTGMIFGTPEYMSPEQARGERPDHRVDIYAVGCILYEMLTGDVPFHAETFMGVLTKHMFEPPEPPTRRAPQAKITAEVEAVVMKGLAKNRDDRYLSMRDFSMAIGACEGGDPAQAWGQEGSGQYRPMGREGREPSAPRSSAPSHTSSETSPATDALTSPSRGRRALWLGVLAGAAVAGTIVLWPRSHVPDPAPPVPVAEPVKPLAVAPPPVVLPAPEAPPPAAPAVHKIRIESDPPGAEIFRGIERLGITNAVFQFEHSTQNLHLRLSKRGFKDTPLEFAPDHDTSYRPRLEPLSRQRPAAPTHRPPVPPVEARPPVKADPPKPAEPVKPPEPPKPEIKKRQARDLMDPFPTSSGNN